MRNLLLRPLVLVLALAAGLFVAQPAYATYGSQIAVGITIKDANNITLATATGWVQFDDGHHLAQYSVTLCRASSYTSPYFSVQTLGYSGSPTTYYTDFYLNGYGCATRGTTVSDATSLTALNITVYNASNFINGQQIAYYQQSQYRDNPYT